MQKKENSKFKDEIAEFKQVIEEKKLDEEQIDLGKIPNHDANDMQPQSKLMAARLNSQQARTRTAGGVPPKSAAGGVFSQLGM